MTPTLTTARLTPRPRALADAPRLVSLIGDYEVSKMLALVPHPYTQDDAQAWLSGALGDPQDTAFVIDRGNGIEGAVSLAWCEPGIRDFGFWLGRPFWGKGIMSEATRAVLDWGFRNAGIARVDSGAYVDNPGSRRIHALLGFTETGRNTVFSKARGCEAAHVNFSLAREDWTPTP